MTVPFIKQADEIIIADLQKALRHATQSGTILLEAIGRARPWDRYTRRILDEALEKIANPRDETHYL